MTTYNSSQQNIHQKVVTNVIDNPFCKISRKGSVEGNQPLEIDISYPLCGKVQDCEEGKKDCEIKNKECEDKVKDCETSRQKCEDKVKDYEKDKKDCETNKQKCEDKVRDCKVEKDKCDGEKQQLIRDIERCKIEKDRCDKETLELERKVKCCKAEKEGCDREKRQLESKIYDFEGEKLKLGRDIERCKIEKTECDKETLKLESKIECHKAEKEECDKENRQLKSKIRDLEDEKYERDTEIIRLKRDIERYKEEKDEVKTEVNIGDKFKISFGPEKKEFTFKSDCESFKTLRDEVDGLVVTSLKTGERVGSANLSFWYFQDDKLHQDTITDPHELEKGNTYLKILPGNEQKPYYKLGLCNKDGNLVTKSGLLPHDEDYTASTMSKCNIVGGEKIELKDYFREDGKPTFILKPSHSEDLGERYCRAEVYKYNPDSDNTEDLIGHLNSAAIKTVEWDSNRALLAKAHLKDSVSDFVTDKKATITILEKDGKYQLDNPIYESIGAFEHTKAHEENTIDMQTTKFIVDEVLCLCDRSVLEDGVQIIG